MPNFGTHTISDLLAMTSGTIAQIGGENAAWEVFRASLAAHNRFMMELVETFCMFTTEKLIGSGGITNGDFEELGELDTPRPQKVTAGGNFGIPMRFYGYGQQWSELFLEEATPAELAGQFLAVQAADKRNIILQINRAMYLSTNYTSIDIRKRDRAELAVKRLANGDGFALPIGVNGETYDATTRTHYLARVSTLAASDLDNLIAAVSPFYTGSVMIAINQANEAAIKALVGFERTVDVRTVLPNDQLYVRSPALNQTNRGDRIIGYYNGAEVWVKPWALANYALAWNTGAPKVLAYRTRTGADNPNNGLRPLYKQRGYPLNMEGWGREFGCAVTNRVGAAVLYMGGTTYADPALPLAA